MRILIFTGAILLFILAPDWSESKCLRSTLVECGLRTGYEAWTGDQGLGIDKIMRIDPVNIKYCFISAKHLDFQIRRAAYRFQRHLTFSRAKKMLNQC